MDETSTNINPVYKLNVSPSLTNCHHLSADTDCRAYPARGFNSVVLCAVLKIRSLTC